MQDDTLSQSVVPALGQEVYGDQNGDGVVNIADVVVGMRIASDGVEPTSSQISLNDLKNDDTIDAADAMIALQHIASAAASLDKLRKVTVDGAEGTVGEVDPETGEVVPARIDIILNDMTTGASGFDLTISVEDASKAIINQVILPDYGLIRILPEPPSPSSPLSTIRIIVVDIGGVLNGTFSSLVIATLEVELLSGGETQVALDLSKLDDPVSNPINLVPGTIRQSGTLVVNAAPQ